MRGRDTRARYPTRRGRDQPALRRPPPRGRHDASDAGRSRSRAAAPTAAPRALAAAAARAAARRVRGPHRPAVPRRVDAVQRRSRSRRAPRTAARRRSSSPTACARAPTTSRTWCGCTSRPASRATARYYDEILAIRAGTAPRPRDYDSSFWDRVLASGKGFVRYGPPQSLIDADARGALRARRSSARCRRRCDASNGLAEVERDVMDARRAAHRARASTRATSPTSRPDYARLIDDDYLAAEGPRSCARSAASPTSSTRARCARCSDARAHVRALSVVQIGDPRG